VACQARSATTTYRKATTMTESKAASAELVYEPPAYLAGLPILTDIEQLTERSIQRIMDAKSPEEALADPDAIGVKDIVGKVVILTGIIGILPSTFHEGDFYIILEARIPGTGAVVTLTTGSPYVAARAVKCQREGWLPRAVRVLELESASNPGQTSLWIVDGPKLDEGTGEVPF